MAFTVLWPQVDIPFEVHLGPRKLCLVDSCLCQLHLVTPFPPVQSEEIDQADEQTGQPNITQNVQNELAERSRRRRSLLGWGRRLRKCGRGCHGHLNNSRGLL